jgi:phage-related tail protein
MKHLIFVLTFSISTLTFGQKSVADSNYIFWSKDRRLQQSDFQIKVGNAVSSYSFAQYSFDYNVISTFTFGLSKDYKKKIRNYFIKSAPWLDTTNNVEISLKYQQTLFDIAEVYVRHFRKSVYENCKKITWGKIRIEELNSQVMTDFSKRRVQYDLASNFGEISDIQKEWETLIAKELKELKEFSAE